MQLYLIYSLDLSGCQVLKPPEYAMSLIMQDKQIFVFHGEIFQLPMVDHHLRIVEPVNMSLYFMRIIQRGTG